MDSMKVLFINCCIRGEKSRTLRLCKAYLKALTAKYPNCEITELYLTDQKLIPLDEQSLKLRDTLIRARRMGPSDIPLRTAACGSRPHRDRRAALES